jgi:hypothetical protein
VVLGSNRPARVTDLDLVECVRQRKVDIRTNRRHPVTASIDIIVVYKGRGRDALRFGNRVARIALLDRVRIV